MDALSYKTVSANSATVKKGWHIVDAEGEVLGRLASKVAYVLIGKNKVDYTPHIDNGDNVVIINADKIRLTGNKKEDKEYIRYTGYPGGQRFATPKELFAKNPTKVVEYAVHGMLPKGRLGNQLKRNVYIYAGTDHPHAAQQPKELKLKSIK